MFCLKLFSRKSSKPILSLQDGLKLENISHTFEVNLHFSLITLTIEYNFICLQIRNNGPTYLKHVDIVLSIPISYQNSYTMLRTDVISFSNITVKVNKTVALSHSLLITIRFHRVSTAINSLKLNGRRTTQLCSKIQLKLLRKRLRSPLTIWMEWTTIHRKSGPKSIWVVVLWQVCWQPIENHFPKFLMTLSIHRRHIADNGTFTSQAKRW